MAVSARCKQNWRETNGSGTGAALHPGKDELERLFQSLHYHYTTGYQHVYHWLSTCLKEKEHNCTDGASVKTLTFI